MFYAFIIASLFQLKFIFYYINWFYSSYVQVNKLIYLMNVDCNKFDIIISNYNILSLSIIYKRLLNEFEVNYIN